MTSSSINLETVGFHGKDILDVLKISSPNVSVVATLFKDEQGRTNAQPELIAEEIPINAKFLGGYYSDEHNVLYLAKKHGGYDNQRKSFIFVDYTDAEVVYIFAHELRHVWQKVYHKSKYYNYNLSKMDDTNDISDIDADAFAMSYVFSAKTSFDYTDLPVLIRQICVLGTIDGGKRWNQAEQMNKEYGFGNAEKLFEAKNCIKPNELNVLLNLIQ